MVYPASTQLFVPQPTGLFPRRLSENATQQRQRLDIANEVQGAIERLVSHPSYPCIAAMRSFVRRDYRIGIYDGFGTGRSSFELGVDLLDFLETHRASKSPYFSFFAAFPRAAAMSEAEFEAALWHELSCVASRAEFQGPWDPKFSADPADKKFCFSLGGKAFFVVGVHTQASRQARQFPWPMLIFNLYEQFEQLMEEGKYEPMVKVNREKDRKLQGSVNPMVEKYGEEWEAIQFSGADNPPEWRCPFRHLALTDDAQSA